MTYAFNDDKSKLNLYNFIALEQFNMTPTHMPKNLDNILPNEYDTVWEWISATLDPEYEGLPEWRVGDYFTIPVSSSYKFLFSSEVTDVLIYVIADVSFEALDYGYSSYNAFNDIENRFKWNKPRKLLVTCVPGFPIMRDPATDTMQDEWGAFAWAQTYGTFKTVLNNNGIGTSSNLISAMMEPDQSGIAYQWAANIFNLNARYDLITTMGNNGSASPYLCSKLHYWELKEFLPALPNSLVDVLNNKRISMEYKYDPGSSEYNPSSAATTSGTSFNNYQIGPIFSLSEIEVTGKRFKSFAGVERLEHQLALFKTDFIKRLTLYKHYKNSSWYYFDSSSFWLRDTVDNSSANVCVWDPSGHVVESVAVSSSKKPFPCFCIQYVEPSV